MTTTSSRDVVVVPHCKVIPVMCQAGPQQVPALTKAPWVVKRMSLPYGLDMEFELLSYNFPLRKTRVLGTSVAGVLDCSRRSKHLTDLARTLIDQASASANHRPSTVVDDAYCDILRAGQDDPGMPMCAFPYLRLLPREHLGGTATTRPRILDTNVLLPLNVEYYGLWDPSRMCWTLGPIFH